MNKEFQSETVQIHVAYSNLCRLFRTILSNYIKKSVVMETSDVFSVKFNDPNNFLPQLEFHFGSKVETSLGRDVIPESELSSFKVNCFNFYLELATQIYRRLSGMNTIMPLLSVCDPNVVKAETVKSLVPLFSKFPQLITEEDYDECNDEWRNLPFHFDKFKELSNPVKFWYEVAKLKQADGQSLFPKLSQLMLNLLVLPHSSAAVERIFSQVNLIKTDTRNRLNTESVNGLILAKENGGNMPCYDWEPSFKMITSAQKVYKNISSL